MAAICEAVWIIDTCHENLCSARSNAWDRSYPLDAWITLADSLKLLDNDLHLRGDRVELREFVIEFAPPEFIGGTVCDWFAE